MSNIDRFAITIPGPPGPAKVNDWKTPILIKGKIRILEGKGYRRWKESAAKLMTAKAGGRCFADGPVLVTIRAHWPRVHRSGPAASLAFGDVDAVAKAVLDALEKGGILGDDAQVHAMLCTKHHSKDNPRIEVVVVPGEA